MVELATKVCLFIFVAFECQNLFFHNGAGGHFGFTPLKKNAGVTAQITPPDWTIPGYSLDYTLGIVWELPD